MVFVKAALLYFYVRDMYKLWNAYHGYICVAENTE